MVSSKAILLLKLCKKLKMIIMFIFPQNLLHHHRFHIHTHALGYPSHPPLLSHTHEPFLRGQKSLKHTNMHYKYTWYENWNGS